MDLTFHESQVVASLKHARVAQMAKLATQLDLSTKTVQRALAKAGYFTSINQNSMFVTLKDVPQFDELGLWHFKKVHFSKHGSLRATLAQLIKQAPTGCTLQELEQCVGTRAHNHVSQLVREGTVNRCLLGKHAVYVSARSRQARLQEVRRRAAEPQSARAISAVVRATTLPVGLDAVTVIRVLVRLLESADASAASVARSLQARRVQIHANHVRQILDFYGLKKTTR